MNKANIHLITGGQRSGKSEYAEKLTLTKSNTPIYLATSKHWDQEFSLRIKKHQQRRTNVWQTIEEELYLSNKMKNGQVVLLDCITLWLNNIMEFFNFDYEKSWAFAQEEWAKLLAMDLEIIVVTNEIGMGVIPFEKGTRRFVDLQGKINQLIAKGAEEVTLMVAGLPVKIKANE